MTAAEIPNSAENPWPVRAVSTRVAKYIDRLGTIWIEGQLTEPLRLFTEKTSEDADRHHDDQSPCEHFVQIHS